MGIAIDLPIDHNYTLSKFYKYENPPAISLNLSESEILEQQFSLYQGSGGSVASLLKATPSGAKTQVSAPPKSRLAMAMSEITQAFNLTKEELAKICGVQSRATLYNWSNGKTKPRKSATIRIFDLLVVSRAWVDSGFNLDRKKIHEPIIEDKSIFDLLAEPKIDKELIVFFGSKLDMISSERDSIFDPFS